jgi:hypothetical protein
MKIDNSIIKLFNNSMSERPVNSNLEELLNEGVRTATGNLLSQFQESFTQERLGFIQYSKKVFELAISQDVEQQANIATLPDDVFEHFTLFYFAQEQTAKEGEEFKPTVGVKLAEYVDEYGRPQGDEIQLRIVIPEDLIITGDTDPAVISAWLDAVSEVYVCHITGNRARRSAAIYRILPEGYQLYSPTEDVDQIDINGELQSFISGISDVADRAKATLNNTYSIFELLTKLGTFKCVPQRYTKL